MVGVVYILVARMHLANETDPAGNPQKSKSTFRLCAVFHCLTYKNRPEVWLACLFELGLKSCMLFEMRWTLRYVWATDMAPFLVLMTMSQRVRSRLKLARQGRGQ